MSVISFVLGIITAVVVEIVVLLMWATYLAFKGAKRK